MYRIHTFSLPPVQTNAYLVIDPSTNEAVLIDAPQAVWQAIEPILKSEALSLKACVLTHAHFDHVLGAQEIHQQHIPLYLHSEDKPLLERLPQQMQFFGLPGESAVPQIDHWIEDGDPLTLLGGGVDVRRVPGHAPGNIVLYFKQEGIAFTGDAIFKGSVGRTDLPGGSFEVLEKGIREQIYTLPGETTLYPGHGPETSVQDEKANNPFVRG